VSNTIQSAEQRRGRGRYGMPRLDEAKEVPCSEEAEQHVLACCLLEGDGLATLNRARGAGIGVNSFYWPRNRMIWEALVGMVEANKELSIQVLAEEMTTRRLFEQAGGFPYLMQITKEIPTSAHARYFIDKLLEKQSLREVDRVARGLLESVKEYTGGGLDTYAPLVEAVTLLEGVKARGKGELPPVLGWNEFLPAEQSKLPDELVQGVLHRGAKLMIAGGSKSFKTWVLLHLGLSVAAGVPWWGMRVVQGNVLYLNMELMREFCEVRVRQIRSAMKVESVPGFHSWHLRGYARDFKELLPHILNRTSEGQYSLIILDPVYKILGERDENANGEVAELLNEFEALATKRKVAIAYGHHHSKGNQSDKDARDRSSGAGAWTRDPDALIDLTPHEEDEHFTATFTLRNHAPKTPMVIRWEFPVMSIAPGMDPTALRKPGKPKQYGVGDVVGLLEGKTAGLMYGEWEAAAKKAGLSESTFKRLIKQAQDSGKVVRGNGVYRLCDAGRAAA
jgi:hypothetical protein